MATTPRQRLLFARARARHAGFLRAADVQRRLGLDYRASDVAAEFFRDGQVCYMGGRRMATARDLRDVAKVVSRVVCFRALMQGCSIRDARAIGAVIRAHILGTSLTLSTITRVFQFGGWIAQIALEMLPRTR